MNCHQPMGRIREAPSRPLAPLSDYATPVLPVLSKVEGSLVEGLIRPTKFPLTPTLSRTGRGRFRPCVLTCL